MTRIQYVSCAINTITIRLSKNEIYSHWLNKVFEHVQNFHTRLLTYAHEKNTIRMDRNGLE